MEKRLHTWLGPGTYNTGLEYSISLSQRVGGAVKEAKGLWSLFGGLPLAKLGEFEHQGKYGNGSQPS